MTRRITAFSSHVPRHAAGKHNVLFCKSISQSVSQWIGKSVSQSVSQSASQSISEWVSEWVSESVSQSVSQARICYRRNSASPQMKGHFRKRFGFLASMNSDNYVNYTKPRSRRDSTSIACPKDAIHKGTNSCLSNMLSVEKVASINKHTSPTIQYQEDENRSLR